MGKIYRAAKYIRTSCPDDGWQHRDSVANQNKIINAFLSSHPDILAVTDKVDEGYSGLFYDRPAFGEMIADIKAGVIDCVVVKDLSRLGRDYVETGRYLRDIFPAYGIRFIAVNDNIDSISLDGFDKTITLIKSIFSERYSYDVSVKTRSALDAKRKDGKYVGASPIYGYRKSLEEKNKLTPDPNTYTVVQSIFDMKLQGVSAAQIALSLNDAGVLSPLEYKRSQGIAHPTGGCADRNNAKWSATTVLRILQDENYTGTLVQGRQRSLNYKDRIYLNVDEAVWIKVKDSHRPIISKMDYDAVQRVLSLDTRTSPGQRHVQLFSGMLFCGHCGTQMTRRIVKKKQSDAAYYYCPKGKENGCQFSGMIHENDLLNAVSHKVQKRIAHIKWLSERISNIQYMKFIQLEYSQKIADNEKKVCELSRYRTRLYDSLIDNIIDDNEFRDLQSYYNKRIACLEDEAAVLWSQSHSAEEVIARNAAWKQYFLQFACVSDLSRKTLVKLVKSIHITSKMGIAVNFICQPEYEQAIRFSALGEHSCGKEEPKTK